MAIAKKTLKKVQQLSFMGEILKEFFTDKSDECFADNAPDFWNRDERNLFDALSELEQRHKNAVLELLTAKALKLK